MNGHRCQRLRLDWRFSAGACSVCRRLESVGSGCGPVSTRASRGSAVNGDKKAGRLFRAEVGSSCGSGRRMGYG